MTTDNDNTPPAEPLQPPEGGQADATDLPDLPNFETLLFCKVMDKPPSTQRSLRAYYRKKFKETGEIPPALFVDEGRRFSGMKSSLDAAVQSRFVDMVIKSADESDIFNFYTQDQRKVTVFHQQLEKEFGRKIAVTQLYALVKSCGLKRYLAAPDDKTRDDDKAPSYFKAEPVGALIQMDGVEADYLEIQHGEGWRKPVWIEFMDFGSRKLLAMHAYLSESNENSVDIFTRFLAGNAFAPVQMKIRPDNAKGFLNLKRPIRELNKKYASAGGFAFLDNFSRASTPKDKAHLESSHRTAHKNLERAIIEHFKSRIAGQYKKHKKVGNRLKTITMTRLAITLDELNASGQTEGYMRRHNSMPHRFTEDGVQRTWVPDDRWQAFLIAHATFKFKAEDIELCRRYGYTKASATIGKDGTITYQKRKFYVADKSHWSRSTSTRVKVSLIGDHLAYFKPSDDGEWLGNATALQAPVKSDRVIEKEKAKVERIHADKTFDTIVRELRAHGMIVDEGQNGRGGKLRQILDEGLTLADIQQILADNGERYLKYANTVAAFNLFASDVKKHLQANKPKKLIPYAG
jgi:hypothetical protein